MPFITFENQATHHYIDEGVGEPLLLFHGFTGSSESWKPLLPLLAQEYRIIAIDLPGHGKTQFANDNPRKFTMYEASIGIHAILRKLQISKVAVCGYSMGSRFALDFACSYPKLVTSLILESASPGLKTEVEQDTRRKADNELADKIEKNGMEWFVDYWEKLPLWDSQTPEQKAYLREQRLKNDPVGLANSLRGMGTGVMPSLWDELAQLPMPVKLIAGELDTKYVAINREMAELIPNTDLSIVAGAGHTVHLEKPDEYAELVLQFLDKYS
jgi:2-succinyl-6-hydroxy-2,4-cyclohexadiene-1-carboxylate synthase